MDTDFDVAIVGGGPAGLSAAIWLGRYLRSVVLIDSGDPRNWETRGIHGYLGLQEPRPAELRAAGRNEARRYGVRLIDGQVIQAHAESDDGFLLRYDPLPLTKARTDGAVDVPLRAPPDNVPQPQTRSLSARRLLLAIGLKDLWPQVPGLAPLYGELAQVCPDCDGYETRGKPTAVFGAGRKAVGVALALRHWTDAVMMCSNGEPLELDAYLRGMLDANEIALIETPIAEPLATDDVLHALRFADGSTRPCEKIFYARGQVPADDLAAQLGCERDDDGHVRVDAAYHSSVRNVFAAGDLVPGPQLGIAAAADGAVAALAIHRSLLPAGRKLKKGVGRPSKPARALVDWTV